MEPTKDYVPITAWAEDDRPREKLTLKGKIALSDAELIAILLGSGSRNESAVDLAKRILFSVDGNLIELSKMNIKELCKFKGIGEAKAISIIAALELGRRRRQSEVIVKKKISGSRDAFEYFHALIGDSNYESFYILLLRTNNTIIRDYLISEGGLAGTVVDAKKIFKAAIENNTSSIILCHNHPSGNIEPSKSDEDLTKKLVQAGKNLDIPVVDHIIIGDDKYFSFADESLLSG
jgi:DNA repair protein RadC